MSKKQLDMNNPVDFVEYLEKTLIPDLKESGREYTAQDFETAVKHIRDSWKEEVKIKYKLAQLGNPHLLPDPNAPSLAGGVICNCPSDFCPTHGELDKSELRKGRKVRN